MASSMVDFLVSRGVEGADVLEVGGGVGAIQVELFKSGVAKSVNVELSAGYEDAARSLAKAEGVEDRVTRRLGDFVEDRDDYEPADIVVMNRVVCCYPWMEKMIDAAVAKTGTYLALSFPRERWLVKSGFALGNVFIAASRCDFRAFVHPVAEIEAIATNAGLVVRHTDTDFIWQALVLERVT
ncbi:MAG: SAM-dependent methyltransferase [Acidobacteria bacterium]|nr:MAG: SAM-dependent methyltransferase [Acidobacteriota bacterium]